MRKLLFLMLAGLFTVLLASCDEECKNFGGECPEEQLAKDLKIIEDYLAENNLTAEKDPSYELYYIITEEGTGDKPANGQKVLVNYVGRFLDGKAFDTSIESVAKDENFYNEAKTYKPFEFTLGKRQVILGWDVGIKLLNKGTKATLILPSYMAYGPRGNTGIPANTVLLFEVELISINN